MANFDQSKLRGNKATALPRHIFTLDTETTEERQGKEKILRFKIAVSNYFRYTKEVKNPRIEEKVWRDQDSLTEYILSKTVKKTTLYIFAHNAAFDLWISGAIPILTRQDWKCNFIYINGLTFILSCRKAEYKIVVISTTNYFSASLKECGKMLGLSKMEVKFDDVSATKLLEYCKRDTAIVSNLVIQYIRFISDHALGKFSYTKPSQAFNAFRHRFMHHVIYIHKEKEVQEIERKCYFGGRCEMFEQGKITGGPFRSYDINSMYPFVMQQEKFPFKLRYFVPNMTKSMLNAVLSEFLVCSHVTLDTDKPFYPVRGKTRTVFPIGKFDTYLCTPELKVAIAENHVVKIHETAVYQAAVLFDDFVDYFYNMRKKYIRENNHIMQYLCKIILNSFYGKFAEQIPITETWDTDDESVKREKIVIIGKQGLFSMYQIMKKVIIEKEKVSGKRAFCAIAAHVTSYARALLNEIMFKIMKGKILYCDTDSIKIRRKDLTYNIDKNKLGSLKYEGETHKFIIHGLKDYRWGSTKIMKGVKKGSKQIGANEFLGERFLKPKTLMRRGIADHVVIVESPKVLKRNYEKGVVLPNRKIRPYCLPEEAASIF